MSQNITLSSSPPHKRCVTTRRFVNGVCTFPHTPRNDPLAERPTRISYGRQRKQPRTQVHDIQTADVPEDDTNIDLEPDLAGPGPEPSSRPQTASLHDDDAWRERLPELQQGYLRQLPAQAQLERQLAAHQQGVYQATVEDLSTSCCPKCGHMQRQRAYTVPVLIIDLTSRVQVDVPVMRCCSPECSCAAAVQPLQLSCWPSNAGKSCDLARAKPTEQQTWFTMRLMAHADLTSMIIRRAPMYRYCQLLEAHAAHCGSQLPVARLDLLLGHALLQYQYVVCWLADLSNLGVEEPQGVLAACAGCWREAGSEQGVHSVYVDFCFKLNHLAKATRTWGSREPPNSRYFLPSNEVRQFQQAASNMDKVEADKDCSDFKAAEVVARRSEKNDVTAVGAITCRHGMPIKLMDIETGERYCYATLFLVFLLQRCALLVRFVWYDINCKYAVHFLAWVAKQQGAIKEGLAAALAKVTPKFPLPVFHQYAHSPSCQRKHGASRMEGAGLANGEPTESFWAFLGEFGWNTQYMQLHNRRGRLERATLFYAQGVAARQPATLSGMFQRALQRRSAAISGIQAVVDALSLEGAVNEAAALEPQVQQLLLEYRQSNQDMRSASACKPWEVEWAELSIKVFYIEQDSSAELPGISITFADSVFQSASAKLAALKKRLRSLERQHAATHPVMPRVDAPGFAPYMDRYISFEVTRLQGVLRMLSVDYLSLDRLYNKLAGRPKVQRTVRTHLIRTSSSMSAELQKLRQLLSKGLQRLPADMQLAAAGYDSWTIADLKAGRLFAVANQDGSSSSSSSQGLPAGASQLLLLERLDSHVQEFSRAQEEVKQLLTEMEDSLVWYAQREGAISSRHQQLLQPEHPEGSTAGEQQGGVGVGDEPGMSSSQEGGGGDARCVPLRHSTSAQGTVYYLQLQLQQVVQQRARAAALFGPAVSMQGVLVGPTVTAAAMLNVEDIENQLQVVADLQDATQQGLQSDAAAADDSHDMYGEGGPDADAAYGDVQCV